MNQYAPFCRFSFVLGLFETEQVASEEVKHSVINN